MGDIRQERKSFEKLLPRLIAEGHVDQWVIVHGGEPIAFAETSNDAYNLAVRELGADEVYLVSQVTEESPASISLSWEAGVMFGG
ncbi:MAG: hypothetical protein SangKO_076080 [Sandaracinaceae bacterium]